MFKKTSFALAAILLFSVSLGAALYKGGTASAVTAADWRAGRIIDDVIFTNKDAMSVAQIQAFLDNNVGTGGYDSIPGQCDSNGARNAQPFSSASRASYAASLGRPTHFTCLNGYYEVPKTSPGPNVPASNYGGAAIPAGAQSAAQLIWNAAQQYNISPKVLLVTIQKESAGPLTTDDWPFQKQYTYAMGAHCPDSGPGGSANCDPNYAGFSIQISESASLLRYYLDNMNQPWWTYKKPGNNTILYNPNTDCGSSNVFVETSATAALYTYTPYQPNTSALNNLYGLGDSCSAYGNRNFWRIYSDWFGTTLAPQYSAQEVWQSVFTNSSKTTSLGWNATLVQGQNAYVVMQMKNTGNITWTRSGGANDTRLATYNPWGRQSTFCTGAWLATSPSCTRAAAMNEASVAPGQTGTFEFPISASGGTGVFNEGFGLVVDGKSVFSDGFANLQITVNPRYYTAQPVWQSVYTDSTKSTAIGWNADLIPGQNAWGVVQIKNTGNFTWTKSGSDTVRLATYDWGRVSPFCAGKWITTVPNCTRAAVLNESSVPPGGIGTFEFPINAPTGINIYNETFGLVVDGKSTFSNGFINFQFNVKPTAYSAQPVWQSVFTNSSKTTSLGWNATLSPGQSAYAVIVMKNTSNFTWTRSGGFATSDVRLATYNPWGRQSAFCTVVWISCNRPSALKETSVAPGQNGTFEFPVTAPTQAAVYNEGFGLVVDGRATFGTGFVNVQLKVQ